MTENQLKYLAYQENQRHNLAAEGLDSGKLDETVRSNLAKEGETARANLVNEGLRERQFLEQLVMDANTRRDSAFNRVNQTARTAADTAQKALTTSMDITSDIMKFII